MNFLAVTTLQWPEYSYIKWLKEVSCVAGQPNHYNTGFNGGGEEVVGEM
jgi:hypothetical protein